MGALDNAFSIKIVNVKNFVVLGEVQLISRFCTWSVVSEIVVYGVPRHDRKHAQS